jgi:antitoxin ParD1/3/4
LIIFVIAATLEEKAWRTNRMSTLNISLPQQMKAFVETQVDEGLYGSASDYIRALIREDQKRRSKEALERKLLAAIASSEYKEGTPGLFEEFRGRLAKKVTEKTEDAL